MPGLLAGRLGLNDDQIRKIREIIEEARSKTLASVKEVLTDDQVRQLEQMQGTARQFGQRMRGPGPRERFGNPMGNRPQRGEGFGDQMQPRGRGRPGQPFGGGQGRGRNLQSQMGPQQPGTSEQPPTSYPRPDGGRSWNRRTPPPEQMSGQADANKDGNRPQRGDGPGDQMQPHGRGRPGQPFGGGQGRGRDPQSQMGPQQPSTPGQPPASSPGSSTERSWNGGASPLEQMFDQADANKDGALTKEEIKAFEDARRGNQPFRQR